MVEVDMNKITCFLQYPRHVIKCIKNGFEKKNDTYIPKVIITNNFLELFSESPKSRVEFHIQKIYLYKNHK